MKIIIEALQMNNSIVINKLGSSSYIFALDIKNEIIDDNRGKFSWVPGGPNKKELLANLDKVPTFVQRLQFTVKDHTVGKAATFTKVDNVIQETKNLMNVISKVVTTCFECATKYNIALPHRVRIPCAALDGKLLPGQLSPQALHRLVKFQSATLPR